MSQRKSVSLSLNCIISFQTLEGTDFTDVRPLFPPMMHTICLVYSHSKYFNSAARIIVLMTVSQYMSRWSGNINQYYSICRKFAICLLTWPGLFLTQCQFSKLRYGNRIDWKLFMSSFINLLSSKVEEALDKVKVSIRNLKEFRACFQEYKSRLPSYFTGDKIPKSWEFQVCLTVSGIFDLIFKLDVLL